MCEVRVETQPWPAQQGAVVDEALVAKAWESRWPQWHGIGTGVLGMLAGRHPSEKAQGAPQLTKTRSAAVEERIVAGVVESTVSKMKLFAQG